MREIRVLNQNVRASEVLRSYWFLAAERQRIYHARLAGGTGPWTADPVLGRYRFTNAYRAADRVSQHLSKIAYAGPQTAEDLVIRVLLYRFFNRPSTWDALEATFDEIGVESFDAIAYGHVLDGILAQGDRVYSAAYTIPPPPFGAEPKHNNHLLLIQKMLNDGLVERLVEAPSLKSVYETVLEYPSLGPFLAYQLTVDVNYTALLNFSENDFVVAGPGAHSGIAKCFPELQGLPAEDIIMWVTDTDNQEQEFQRCGIKFHDLLAPHSP